MVLGFGLFEMDMQEITYYEFIYTFFSVLFSLLLLIKLYIQRRKFKSFRLQMVFKLFILFTTCLIDIPFSCYALQQKFDQERIDYTWIYWLGLLNAFNLLILPLAVMFLIIDRIIVLMVPRVVCSQRTLLIICCVTMSISVMALVVLSVVLEKPIKPTTSK